MNCCLRVPEILIMKRKTPSENGEFPEKRNRSNGSCSPSSSSQTQVCPGWISIIATLHEQVANFQ